MIGGGDVAEGAILRRRPGLSQIARNARDDRALLRREAIELGAGDDVLRVPMVSLVVHVLADIAQHGGGFEPLPVFGRQSVHRLQIAEELRRMRAHRLCLPRIDAVALAGVQHALPSIALELLVRAGARILLGQHLGQNRRRAVRVSE